MKRDLDLVRYILLCVEDSDEPVDETMIMKYGCDMRTAAFHVELMAARGLVLANVTYASGDVPVDVAVSSLTWEGYDYLDAIRSSVVWKQAKEAIAKTVGDASLSVAKDVCTALSASLVKSSLGI